MRVFSRAGLIVVVLTIVGGMTGPAVAQEAEPASPAPPAPQGGATVARPPVDPRQRGVRGRDVLTLSTSASVGTNGRGGTEVGFDADTSLFEATVLSDVRASLTWKPTVSPSWQVTGDIAYRGYDDRRLVSLGRSVGTSLAWGGSRARMNVFGAVSDRPIYYLVMTGPSISEELAQAAVERAIAEALGTQPVAAAIVDSRSGLLPDITTFDYGVATTPAYTGGAGSSFSYQLTSRWAAGVQASVDAADFKTQRNRDMRNYGASGNMSFGLFDGINLRAGYGRQRAEYYLSSGTEIVVFDSFDAGVDVTRGFSLNRRGLTVGGRTGMAASTDGVRRHYYATGALDLRQAIGRSASLNAGFTRDVHFQYGFLRPVMADSIAAGGGGRLWGSATWNVSAQRSYGLVLLEEAGRSNPRYHATSGSAKVTMPMGRRAGVYVQYVAYQQNTLTVIDLLDFVPGDGVRQTARVGFTLDLPLLRDERPPRRERR